MDAAGALAKESIHWTLFFRARDFNPLWLIIHPLPRCVGQTFFKTIPLLTKRRGEACLAGLRRSLHVWLTIQHVLIRQNLPKEEALVILERRPIIKDNLIPQNILQSMGNRNCQSLTIAGCISDY